MDSIFKGQGVVVRVYYLCDLIYYVGGQPLGIRFLSGGLFVIPLRIKDCLIFFHQSAFIQLMHYYHIYFKLLHLLFQKDFRIGYFFGTSEDTTDNGVLCCWEARITNVWPFSVLIAIIKTHCDPHQGAVREGALTLSHLEATIPVSMPFFITPKRSLLSGIYRH